MSENSPAPLLTAVADALVDPTPMAASDPASPMSTSSTSTSARLNPGPDPADRPAPDDPTRSGPP
ncbi:hypothetical protein [Kitasatospora sp. NPDC056181]|uniref:hypothetical protein n=1 Tax=Kitasatospora sp. NPDC056181 TaxID=3345737 RepID=UPI0035DA0E18